MCYRCSTTNPLLNNRFSLLLTIDGGGYEHRHRRNVTSHPFDFFDNYQQNNLILKDHFYHSLISVSGNLIPWTKIFRYTHQGQITQLGHYAQRVSE